VIQVEDIKLKHQILVNLVGVMVLDALHGSIHIVERKVSVALGVFEPANLRRVYDEYGVSVLDCKRGHF
jgi:hypothetical protein